MSFSWPYWMASSKAVSAFVEKAESVMRRMPSSVMSYSTSTTSTSRRTMGKSISSSPRRTVMVSSVPASPRTRLVTAAVSMLRMSSPLTPMSWSPTCMPASLAGLSG